MNFEQWLIQLGKSKSSAYKYSRAIFGVMSEWANESLGEIASPGKLKIVAAKLNKLDIYIQRNAKGNGMYRAALKSYIDYLSDNSAEKLKDDLDEIIQNTGIKDTEKSTLISARVGQGKFRKGLIDYWNGCALTGFSDTRFLVASHIKPWRNSENNERLDQFNGLLLLPNIDKAFDLGFVSFHLNSTVIYCFHLSWNVLMCWV